MTDVAGSMNTVSNWRYVDGRTEPVYLCRCGVEHTGDYAAYEYGHHMCFHDAPLWEIGDEHFICADCGKSFTVEDHRRPAQAAEIRRQSIGVRPVHRAAPMLSRWQQILEYLKALYR